MEVMTFNIDKDRRNLVDDKQNYNIDFHDSKYNWLQARQYEESMRQVEVHVVHGDGSPVDLTGVNPVFEGWLPEGLYRIIDAKHSVMVDAQNGIFRFDFPAPAFQIAGSYKQAFFRLMKDGKSVTTLEFSLDVMADKVISGLVPSDYMTPFEDLYGKLKDYITKANGDFETAMAQWKKDVAGLITELNTDVSGINLTITEIKSQLSALEDKIKADGLLTQAEFDEQIKIVNQNIENALNELKHPILIDDSLMIGKPVSDGYRSAIENLRAGIDDSLFNFTFITDAHYGRWDKTYTENIKNTLGIDNLNTALAMDGAVDAIISGGDNIDGWTDGLDEMLYETKEYATDMLFETDNKSDKFILKGNHDDASGRLLDWYRGNRGLVYDSAPAVIKNQQIQDDYCNAELLFNEKRQGDSNYFYKDYPDKKIRLIGLDSNDTPDNILGDDGAPKYYGIGHMGFQETQLKWLAEIALKNVPKDYTTVIVAHIQAEDLSNGKDEFYYNQKCLQQIINDFMQGKSSVISSNTKDWEVNMQTDFTAQGARMFAGYIHGHQHKETYNSDLGFNNIGVTCAVDPETTAWNVITIDTTNHKVILTGFGRATNRKFDYLGV
ncbi:phage baseplate upper protein [Pediococcus acidilactici]|uniref:phage baseplate upper protein n=1 Tax=Pediococcus acidilactici TaxID=1254 RepID=UPI003F1EF130